MHGTFMKTPKIRTSLKQSFLRGMIILCLLMGEISLFSSCSKGKSSAPSMAPDFALKTLDGQEITLSQLKGKTVLLDFWATWCGPCRESIPHLIQLYKTYQGKGFEVIGMNLDKGDIEVIRHFIKSMDIPYPVVVSSEDIARNYGVTGLPTSFFIDKEGKIREKIMGFNSSIARHLEAKAEELTSEKP